MASRIFVRVGVLNRVGGFATQTPFTASGTRTAIHRRPFHWHSCTPVPRIRQPRIQHRIPYSSGRTPNPRPDWRPPPTLTRRSAYARFADALNRIPHSWIVWGLLGANTVVFGCWQWAQNEMRNGHPDFLVFMRKNFLASRANLSAGRIWTLVTNAFSQSDLFHFAMNALGIYWMAPAVLSAIGGAHFTALYFSGALVCACTTLFLSRSANDVSHGASGAIYAIVSAFAAMFPRATFYIYAVIPAPAWACVGGILAWDGWNAWTQAKRDPAAGRTSTTNYIGHVAGVMTGIGYVVLRVVLRWP